MTDTHIPPAPPAEPGAALLRTGGFLRPGRAAPGPHSVEPTGGSGAAAGRRDRWSPGVAPGRPERYAYARCVNDPGRRRRCRRARAQIKAYGLLRSRQTADDTAEMADMADMADAEET